MKKIRIDRAKPSSQAIKAMDSIVHRGLIKSVGTNRNYRQRLTLFAKFIQEKHLGDLRHSTVETALSYLDERSTSVAQKTLDMDRQAIQAFFQSTKLLSKDQRLPIIKSQKETVLRHRAYTKDQVIRIFHAQTRKNAFSTILAYSCGLRAHELLNICPITERPATKRFDEKGVLKNLPTKWLGRPIGVPYTVIGKGGLIREIRIPKKISEELETYRLKEPKRICDRECYELSFYDLAGGKQWSDSFHAASKRVLGWSKGAHGLRHSYAQNRMLELARFCDYQTALETVSQEMGHFREKITLVYLR